MEFQEKTHNIGQDSFATPVFPGVPWELPPPEGDEHGGFPEGKLMRDEFQEPDREAGKWK